MYMALGVVGRPSFVLNYIHFPSLLLLPRTPFGFRLFSNRLIFDTGRGVALLKEEKWYKGRNDDYIVRQAGRTNTNTMRSNRKELEGTHRRHRQYGQREERLISFPVCPFGRSPDL